MPQLADHIKKLNDSEVEKIWEESVEKKYSEQKMAHKHVVADQPKDTSN